MSVKQHTKESLAAELTRLRADCEQVKRQQQVLQARTSRLDVAIESLAEAPKTALKT